MATVSCDLDRPDMGDIFCSVDSGSPEACEFTCALVNFINPKIASFTLNSEPEIIAGRWPLFFDQFG